MQISDFKGYKYFHKKALHSSLKRVVGNLMIFYGKSLVCFCKTFSFTFQNPSQMQSQDLFLCLFLDTSLHNVQQSVKVLQPFA